MKTLFILFTDDVSFFSYSSYYNTKIQVKYINITYILASSLKKKKMMFCIHARRRLFSKLNYTFYFGRSCHRTSNIIMLFLYKIIFQWKYDERNLHYLTIYVLFCIIIFINNNKMNDEQKMLKWCKEKGEIAFPYRLIWFNCFTRDFYDGNQRLMSLKVVTVQFLSGFWWVNLQLHLKCSHQWQNVINRF